MFGPSKAELRARVEALEARAVVATQSSPDFARVFGLSTFSTVAAEVVTIESALGVPAIWAAVNFLAGTIAGLPLQVFQKTDKGREPANSPLTAVLNDVANQDDLTSAFEWLKWWVEQALTGGRGVTWIERNAAGRILNLWPLEPARLTIRRKGGRRVYEYREDGGQVKRYEASEVLDLPFMLGADRLSHRSPIMANREVVGLAQAVTKYGARFFANGGVPAFAVTGNFQSPGSLQRASEDLAEAVKKAATEQRQALTLPTGLDIKSLGIDGQKAQMIETQRFLIEQIARIYSLPPVMLQDLTHGTFSNTEQQDLHLVKHTIKRWVEQIEQEINLKFFGRGSKVYAEFNLDGLLRGDFKTRFEGYAAGIRSGVLTPNEARAMENRPDEEGGHGLFMQGAMMPIGKLGQEPAPNQPPGGTDDEP